MELFDSDLARVEPEADGSRDEVEDAFEELLIDRAFFQSFLVLSRTKWCNSGTSCDLREESQIPN
jgi:hypothetical protein